MPQQRAELRANVPFPGTTIKSEIKANEEFIANQAKIPQQAQAKESETAATESGKEVGLLGKNKETAIDTIGAAQRVIDLSNDPTYSKLMGYFEGGDKRATFAVKALNFTTAKLFGQEEFENAIAALGFNQTERARLQQLKTDANKLAIEYTAQMFKGARLGIGLEKLGAQGKGVSASFTPETNRLYATITRDNAQFVLDSQKEFRDNWLPKHPNQTYGEFLRSKDYDVMLDNHLEKEKKLYGGTGVTFTKLSPEQAEKTGRKVYNPKTGKAE